jgi:hypothetical protein
MHWRASTHPDYATLVDPLFAFGGKRVKKCFLQLNSIVLMKFYNAINYYNAFNNEVENNFTDL